MATIQVALGKERALLFLRALLRNLDQLEIARVLPWVRGVEGNFHTRIQYGQAPVVLSTIEEDGKRVFLSLMLQMVTQPLEPDNADDLVAMIERETLGEEASIADALIEQLERLFGPEDHELARVVDKFMVDNR